MPNPLSLTYSCTSPALARALRHFISVQGLDHLVYVQAGAQIELGGGADGESAPPLRLGLVLDWLLRRQNQSEAVIPARLKVVSGALEVGAGYYVPENGSRIRLTEKEVALISALYRAPGRKLDKSALLDCVWGYVPGVETHTLETHIYRLRQKIEVDPGQPQILQTLDGGYHLALVI
jgi:hypothetical protein